MNTLFIKFREVLFAVLPITAIVLILHFTGLTPIDGLLLLEFLIGTVIIIIGFSIFLTGIDIGITPIGNSMGSAIAKSNKIWVVLFSGLAIGFFISVAEPMLQILGAQVESATSGAVLKLTIVIFVSIGIAALLTFGLFRIIYNISLRKSLVFFYLLILIIAIFTAEDFLPIAFDASASASGALTVPFMLSLAIGVSMLKKDSKSSESDSFGLIGIASTGAIMSIMLISIISGSRQMDFKDVADDAVVSNSIFASFFKQFPQAAKEAFVSLIPIVFLFLLFQLVLIKMSKRALRKILIGTVFTYLGFCLLLTGVNGGFLEVGREVGKQIAQYDSKAFIIATAFAIGVVTIIAESSVHVLMKQIEDVTSGYIRRKAVMVTFALGMGVAVSLSILRILVPEVKLWHFLLPGYLTAIVLSFIVPDLFVGLSFDSGGVASGIMTATFILPFAQGAADAVETADVLADGFGIIAMVAMFPVISLQLLGLVYKIKSKRRVNNES